MAANDGTVPLVSEKLGNVRPPSSQSISVAKVRSEPRRDHGRFNADKARSSRRIIRYLYQRSQMAPTP